MDLDKDLHDISKDPVSIYFIKCDREQNKIRPNFDEHKLLLKIDKSLFSCAFRGTSFENLQYIIKNGVDVDVDNPIIYAELFDKAWEYGGWPKIILGYNYDYLEKTYKEVSADISEDEYQKLKMKYPTELRSEDGKNIWFSKLSEDDTRIASPYEVSYAYWIKGNPLDALRVILIFASENKYIKKVKDIVN